MNELTGIVVSGANVMNIAETKLRSLKRYILLVVISAIFVAVGHSFVLQRTLQGPTDYLTIRGDTHYYVSMIEGNIAGTSGPFKYRLLVPFIAGLLPFSPTENLRIVSYCSLLIFYFFILLTCSHLNLSAGVSMLGMITVFSSRAHLYYYHNPFLTDAFGLMCLSVMIYALCNRSFLLFALTGLIGVLAREQVIFLAPVWCEKKRELRTCVTLASAMLLTLALPRVMLPSNAALSDQLTSKLSNSLSFHPLAMIFLHAAHAWGITWFVALIGLLFVPGRNFTTLAASTILLLLGAMVTSLLAVDTERMFSVVAPVFAIGAAFFFKQVLTTGRKEVLFGCLILLLVQAVTAIPNSLIGEGSQIFDVGGLRILTMFVLFGCILWVLSILQPLVTHAWLEKFKGSDNPV
jgi:hypothetical protein